MSDYRHSEIIYEEGWREASQPPAPDMTDETPEDETAAVENNGSRPLLVTIRLVLCLIAAAALLILRALDSEWYHGFMTYYRVEMNKPVIAQDFFEALDLSRVFGGSGVQVKASPDELLHR
jgi:hypothetical protein